MPVKKERTTRGTATLFEDGKKDLKKAVDAARAECLEQEDIDRWKAIGQEWKDILSALETLKHTMGIVKE